MSMSIAMANGMNALISVSNQMSDLQSQATTGKKINDASDGLASYLSAKGYSQRADRLQNTNDTLGTNLQTVKAAQTGLDAIRKTITDTLDTLKAASQTQSFVAATNTTDTFTVGTSNNNTQIGMTLQYADGNGQQQNNAITAATALVNPLGVNNASIRVNGQNLVQGQVFSINNKFIRISGAVANDPLQGTNDGSSAANATYVRTVADFLAAVRGAMGGVDNSPAAANTNLNGFRIIANATGTINISQVAGAVATTSAIFQANRGNQANPVANYSEDRMSQINTVGGYQTYSVSATDHTVSAGTNGQAADARRAAAAKSFKLAIDQINQYLKSASVSGTNLLGGDTLKVTFDEKGNSSTLQLQDAAGNALKFDSANLGLVNAQTGASADIATNFQVNDDAALDAAGNSTLGLNASINKLTSALTNLGLGDAQVAQFSATVSNRVDFNKSIVSLLNNASNNLTAADMNMVSAQYAALQVQQGFAQTILANTKQSDQSVLQLLR